MTHLNRNLVSYDNYCLLYTSCCSGLQVQGTAISPAARNLIIDAEAGFVKVQTEINQFILSVQYCTAPFLVLRRVKLI